MYTSAPTVIVTSYNLRPGDAVEMRHDVLQGCTTYPKGTPGNVVEVNRSPISWETLVGVSVPQRDAVLWLQPVDLIKLKPPGLKGPGFPL